jgi:hypothetical protein
MAAPPYNLRRYGPVPTGDAHTPVAAVRPQPTRPATAEFELSKPAEQPRSALAELTNSPADASPLRKEPASLADVGQQCPLNAALVHTTTAIAPAVSPLGADAAELTALRPVSPTSPLRRASTPSSSPPAALAASAPALPPADGAQVLELQLAPAVDESFKPSFAASPLPLTPPLPPPSSPFAPATRPPALATPAPDAGAALTAVLTASAPTAAALADSSAHVVDSLPTPLTPPLTPPASPTACHASPFLGAHDAGSDGGVLDHDNVSGVVRGLLAVLVDNAFDVATRNAVRTCVGKLLERATYPSEHGFVGCPDGACITAAVLSAYIVSTPGAAAELVRLAVCNLNDLDSKTSEITLYQSELDAATDMNAAYEAAREETDAELTAALARVKQLEASLKQSSVAHEALEQQLRAAEKKFDDHITATNVKRATRRRRNKQNQAARKAEEAATQRTAVVSPTNGAGAPSTPAPVKEEAPPATAAAPAQPPSPPPAALPQPRQLLVPQQHAARQQPPLQPPQPGPPQQQPRKVVQSSAKWPRDKSDSRWKPFFDAAGARARKAAAKALLNIWRTPAVAAPRGPAKRRAAPSSKTKPPQQPSSALTTNATGAAAVVVQPNSSRPAPRTQPPAAPRDASATARGSRPKPPSPAPANGGSAVASTGTQSSGGRSAPRTQPHAESRGSAAPCPVDLRAAELSSSSASAPSGGGHTYASVTAGDSSGRIGSTLVRTTNMFAALSESEVLEPADATDPELATLSAEQQAQVQKTVLHLQNQKRSRAFHSLFPTSHKLAPAKKPLASVPSSKPLAVGRHG